MMDNNSSSRLRPYGGEANSVKSIQTFQKGEKVEAIWSTDGQRYPGTIVHVYPNDNYEILFNDGVKTRKKSNQIFKLSKRRQVRPLPNSNKNLHPSSPAPQVPVVTATVTTATAIKPLPALIPVKTPSGNQRTSVATGGIIPPPPPLINHSSTNNNESESPISSASASPHSHFHNSSDPNEETNRPTSNTVLSSTSKVTKIIPSTRTTTIESSSGGGDSTLNSSAADVSNTSGNSAAGMCTKRGYMYVQQPHYSVFDPPPTDLGKRRRRVHNYSMLAKGPPLKGGLLSGSTNVNDDGILDGESSRSASPSSPGGAASNSNSTPTTVTRQDSASPVPAPTATVTRRRFLTYPTKSSSSKIFTSNKTAGATTVEKIVDNSGSKTLASTNNSNSSSDVSVSSPQVLPKSSRISISDSNSNTGQKDVGETGTPVVLSKAEFKSKINSSAGNRNSKSTESTPQHTDLSSEASPVIANVGTENHQEPATVPNDNDDGIPKKRLRKPNYKRFGAEEGYEDIFTSRKTKRTTSMPPRKTSSRGRTLQPNLPQEASDMTPKLQVQRPRSKSYTTQHPSKKTRELGPPLLLPENNQEEDSENRGTTESLTTSKPDVVVEPKSSVKSKFNNSDNLDVSFVHSPTPSPKFEEEEDTTSQEVVEEDEEEELLDVGPYTVLATEMPKTKTLKTRVPGFRPSDTSQVKVQENDFGEKSDSSKNKTVLTKPVGPHPHTTRGMVPKLSSSSPPLTTNDLSSSLIQNVPVPVAEPTTKRSPILPETLPSVGIRSSRRTKGRARRWTLSDVPKKDDKLPSVVLDRLPSSKVQSVVQKCDSAGLSTATSSKSVENSMEESSATEPMHRLNTSAETKEVPAGSSPYGGSWKQQQRRKRWGEGKNKWTKSQQKSGGLLRPGIRVHDSLTLQLIKRSRIQRRYEKRGRPKEALLNGISKKKLKKIHESVRRRKLRIKKIQAETKFKDVRVDIINCICGRTDEFGLMVQCEVCLCWQHGNCFHIYDRTRLPKFYVCQSCNSPKSVRPSKLTEGVRMETYKKGVLPSYPFAPKPSERRQRIIKTCNELSKVIQSIDDVIRQNKIKEKIATAEPENPKLYQWSVPRTGPKDQIQKWQFNKYFKSVLRRLMSRHKNKSSYVEKLKTIVSFREKLKKYSQAFEDARSAISRKIGSRGLILIEKLSNHQRKLEKIVKSKHDMFPASKKETVPPAAETSKSNAGEQLINDPVSSPSLPPPPPPLQGRDAEDKVALECNSEIGVDVNNTESWLETMISAYDEALDEYNDTNGSDSDYADTDTDSDESVDENETDMDEVGDVPVPMVEDWTAVMETKLDKEQNKISKLDSSSKPHFSDLEVISAVDKPKHRTTVSPEELADNLEEKVNVRRSRHLEEPVEPIRRPDAEGDTNTVDQIKVIEIINDSTDESTTMGDLESQMGSLSGDTTESAEDTEGGEDYWMHPITDWQHWDSEYEDFIDALQDGSLLEDDKKNDLNWTPTQEDLSNKDWRWDLETEVGLEEESVSDLTKPSGAETVYAYDKSLVYTSSEDEEDENCDSELGNDLHTGEDVDEGSTKSVEHMPKMRLWQKAILTLENEETDDENDEDWRIEEAVQFVSASESDSDLSESETNEMETEDGDTTVLPSSSVNKLTLPSRLSVEELRRTYLGTKSGLMLLTSDPDVKPGEIVEVCLDANDAENVIGTGVVVSGGKGQNFIKLNEINHETKSSSAPDECEQASFSQHDVREQNNDNPIQNSTLAPHNMPLCKSCRDSLGSKWNWNQLAAAKGVDIVYENTIEEFVDELKRYRDIGVQCASTNVDINVLSNKSPRGNATQRRHEQYLNYMTMARTLQQQINMGRQEPGGLLSNPELRSILREDKSNADLPLGVPRPLQPTSAEEVSILSLLSLSKTPSQFNGENISELSIESLRKLTDRLQSNGPLSEDLAKAVGQPLLNGKMLQEYHTLQNALGLPNDTSPVCVRCNLKGKGSKILSICTTTDADFASNSSAEDVINVRKEITEAVRQARASAHVLKRAILNKITKMVDRRNAEKLALAAGQKITPEAVQRRLSIKRCETYLQRLKSEYMEALMPYSTYFISRFTKREEISQAKQTWIIDMIHNYNKAKRSLKKMLESETDESRTAKEDKFYTALDNLRKSFDIVLTKKDIKMRRQNQNSTSGAGDLPTVSQSQSGLNDVKPDEVPQKPVETETPTCPPTSVAFTLLNGDTAESLLASVAGDINLSNGIIPLVDLNSSEANQSAEAEMEIVKRLTSYPIGDEDVDALLGIALAQNKDVIKTNFLNESNLSSTSTPASLSNGFESITDSINDSLASTSQAKEDETTPNADSQSQNQNGTEEESMEIDDLLLAENLGLKTTDSMLISGDLDLINTIGTLSSSGELKGTEDSELLLNVFEDPVFSEPQDEQKPCCSKSLTNQSQSSQPPKNFGPVLQKLTPEMCRGYLLEDIRAHQQVIDTQLDRVEADIMELERKRGRGLREKDDDKLFEMLYANMQILMYNMDVLSRLNEYQVGENDPVEEENENNSQEEQEHKSENDEYEDDQEEPSDEEVNDETDPDVEPDQSDAEENSDEDDETEQIDDDMTSEESDIEDFFEENM